MRTVIWCSMEFSLNSSTTPSYHSYLHMAQSYLYTENIAMANKIQQKAYQNVAFAKGITFGYNPNSNPHFRHFRLACHPLNIDPTAHLKKQQQFIREVRMHNYILYNR